MLKQYGNQQLSFHQYSRCCQPRGRAPRCKLNRLTEIYIFLTTKAMWFDLTKTNSLGHSMLPPLSFRCSSPSVLKYMKTFVQHNYILRCFRSFKPSQLGLNTTSYFGSRTIHTCIPLSIAFFDSGEVFLKYSIFHMSSSPF